MLLKLHFKDDGYLSCMVPELIRTQPIQSPFHNIRKVALAQNSSLRTQGKTALITGSLTSKSYNICT